MLMVIPIAVAGIVEKICSKSEGAGNQKDRDNSDNIILKTG